MGSQDVKTNIQEAAESCFSCMKCCENCIHKCMADTSAKGNTPLIQCCRDVCDLCSLWLHLAARNSALAVPLAKVCMEAATHCSKACSICNFSEAKETSSACHHFQECCKSWCSHCSNKPA